MKTIKEHKAKREKNSLLQPLANHKGKEEGKKEIFFCLNPYLQPQKGKKGKERKLA
jgi:hypothetical protein